MPFFQQFTGINAIIFYSPVFFSSLGSGDKTALESSCIVGAVNVLSTLVAVFGVDRLGRRVLLLQAGVQMFIAEIIVAILLGHYFASAQSWIPTPSGCACTQGRASADADAPRCSKLLAIIKRAGFLPHARARALQQLS